MLLSEIEENNKPVDSSLVYDATFEHLGYLDSAQENLLTYAVSEQFIKQAIQKKNVTALITTYSLAEQIQDIWGKGLVATDEPGRYFFYIHNMLAKNTDFYSKKERTVIDASAEVHFSACIAEENVVIGKNCIIGPNVVILPGSHLSENVVVGANTTIGSVGLEYKRFQNELLKVEHVGRCYIKKNVDIQDNSSIGRGLFNDVIIGEQSKIGSLVRIGHDVQIGQRVMVCSHSLISGSTIVDDDVWIGAGSIISNQLRIAKGAKILIGSVVVTSVLENREVAGNFAIDRKKFFKHIQALR